MTEEGLITAIARLILPARHVAVGAASPIPAAASFLAREMAGDLRISLLHQREGNPFTDGTGELFDLAAQGRIDLFFLGGGEIDGTGNINLIGIGEWPGRSVRFPGSFGSAFMYMMVPRTILFRLEHSKRVLVPRVAHISAPGTSPPGTFRRGHADALVTGRAVFRFSPAHARFTLVSVHPGESEASIRAATGFDYDIADGLGETAEPAEEELALLRGPVAAAMAPIYPAFAARLWPQAPARRSA
ncbi:MAG TPA: CoA-transferase [Acetobacteraceae bacterium]|nr:CoA-transferase [Acetobacteraceae bacterium]